MNSCANKSFLIVSIWLLSSWTAYAENNVRLGNDAFKKGNFTEAVHYYEKALVNYKSADVYINLGHGHSRLGNWESAIQAYNSAIETQEKKSSIELLRSLGYAQYMAEYFAKALDTFQTIYASYPESEDQLWIARCFIQTNQWTRGQDILLRYLRSNPESIEALQLLTYLFSQSDRIDEAIVIHKNIVNDNPGQMEYLLALAKAQTTAKNYDQAIETLEFAQRTTNQQTKEANQLLADLYINREMYREAAQCYQNIILASESPSAEDYYRLGQAYFKTGEFLSARQAFETINILDSISVKAILYLGYIAEEEGETETARQYYLKAIEVNKSSIESYLALAELELKNDSFIDASKYYSKAIEHGEQSVAVYYNHVLSLMLAQNYDVAKAAIKQALTQHPADEQLNDLLEQLIRKSITL